LGTVTGWVHCGLGGDRQPAWRDRAHFFAVAAEAMRNAEYQRTVVNVFESVMTLRYDF
jgi:hypothetical protein